MNYTIFDPCKITTQIYFQLLFTNAFSKGKYSTLIVKYYYLHQLLLTIC